MQAYDAVGYASWYGEELSGNRTATGEMFDAAAITAAHRTLPLGSIAEVTALETGRTILVRVNDRGPGRADREIDLSRGAAALLGTGTVPVAPVRVRGVVAAPADLAELRAGRPAGRRLDAPPALLVALRRSLPQPSASATPAAPVAATPKAAPPPRPAPPAREGRYSVQVASFSSEQRARALARAIDGDVARAGAVWRVRLGPFRGSAEAQRARDGVARRGYGDARVLADD